MDQIVTFEYVFALHRLVSVDVTLIENPLNVIIFRLVTHHLRFSPDVEAAYFKNVI